MTKGDISERLRVLFLGELDEHAGRLSDAVEELAASLPAVDPTTVSEMFRSAHSLKGAAQATGTKAVELLCERMEDVLAQVREGSREIDADLLASMGRATDVLAQAHTTMRSGEEPSEAEAAAVAAELAGEGPPPQPSPAAEAPGDASSETEAPPAAGQGSGVGEVGDISAGADVSAAGHHGQVSQSTQSDGHRPSASSTVRVDVARLDGLLAQARRLAVEAKRSESLARDLAEISTQAAADEQELIRDRDVILHAVGHATSSVEVHRALDRLQSRQRLLLAELERLSRSSARYDRGMWAMADRLADAAWRVRAVAFTEAASGLSRVVRDLCHESGKEARLVIDAANVEVDRSLVQTLHDVLRHLIRNAVDHGIESPAERQAAGKSPVGTITVSARLHSSGLEIAIEDDGRGIDRALVRGAVQNLGEAGDGAALTDDAVVQAVFRAGVTTARTPGAVSGRGVGLDAVRAAVEAVGGTVRLTFSAGHGVRVALSVPLDLSAMRVVLVRVGQEAIAIPSSAVRAVRRVPVAGTLVGGASTAEIGDEVVRVVALADALGWSMPAGPAGESDSRAAVVVSVPEGMVALAVDEIVAERDLMVQATGPRLAHTPTLLGMAQLADGQLALVVSPSACVRRASTTATRPTPAPQPASRRRVLLAEDTLTTRELERGILEGAGYTVLVAVDGMEAWELLQRHEVDVVVSDITMPRMDGIALCTALRRSPRWAQLPVILVSSLASDEDRRRGLEAGADAYLSKHSFDHTELLAAVERLL